MLVLSVPVVHNTSEEEGRKWWGLCRVRASRRIAERGISKWRREMDGEAESQLGNR